MTTTRKRTGLTAALAASALLAAGCSSSGTSGTSGGAEAAVEGTSVSLSSENCPATATTPLEEGEDIVIGTSLALSGPVAAAGQDTVPVIEAYFQMINDEGGIDGHQIRLNAKDDAYEAARAVSNVKTLLESDNVMATMLQLGTAQATAVQQMHEQQCTPQLYVSSGAPNFYDPAAHPFSTSNFFPYSANGELMAAFLEERYPDGAKVGELRWNNDFGTTASEAFTTAIEGTSTEVVAQAEHDATAVSLASQVTQLLSAAPDVLVASTGSSFCSQFIGEARDKGFDGPILLPYACSDASDVLAPLGDKAANVFAGQSLIDPAGETDTEGVEAYRTWLQEYAPEADPKSSFVALGYQMSALLAEQLKRAAESETGLSKVGLMEAVWNTDAVIGLNYPDYGTVINGEFPYPTGYATMSEYDPQAGAWVDTGVDMLGNGEQP